MISLLLHRVIDFLAAATDRLRIRQLSMPPGTPASLFVHGALMIVLGLDLIIEKSYNFKGDSWRPALDIMPIHSWAVVFLGSGALILGAVLHGSGRATQLALFVGLVLTLFIGSAWLVAGASPHASRFTGILCMGLSIRALLQVYQIERFTSWRKYSKRLAAVSVANDEEK